jgi:phage shock protein PspC (stress-responsive transcriptional regulator)
MSEHITHTPQIKRLERSSSHRMVAGVSGGLGRYFDLNPAVFRLGFVILTLLGGAGILVYLAALLVIPAEGSEQSIAEQVLAERRDRPWPVVGLGLAGVALVLLLSRGELAAGAGWIVVLLGGLTILWVSRRREKGRRILIAVGAFFALVAVAAAVAVVTAFAWFDVSLGDGVGDRTYLPASASALEDSYRLGIGNLEVDLSQVEPAGTQLVDARVGIGRLRIVVPRDADVRVDAHATAGEVFVLGNHDDGRNATAHVGNGQFEIDARVGAGRIDVVRAG